MGYSLYPAWRATTYLTLDKNLVNKSQVTLRWWPIHVLQNNPIVRSTDVRSFRMEGAVLACPNQNQLYFLNKKIVSCKPFMPRCKVSPLVRSFHLDKTVDLTTLPHCTRITDQVSSGRSLGHGTDVDEGNIWENISGPRGPWLAQSEIVRHGLESAMVLPHHFIWGAEYRS